MIANENRRFAVLIDADNAQASTIESILAEIARYGTVTSKRCYGDWTKTNLSPWKTTLLKYVEFILRKDSHPFVRFMG